MDKPYFVYILLCNNGHYYTGYTDNLAKRYNAHLNGTSGSKYTRSFKPVSLAQSWQIKGEKSLAMRIERQIKALSKKQKIQLLLAPLSLSTDARVIPLSTHDIQLLLQETPC